MRRLAPLLLAFLALLAIGGPAPAQLGRPGGNHMNVSLVAEHAVVAPGSTVTLAFAMRPQPGWHGYWRNPGDAGAAPRVRWRLPEGWTAGALQYPVPHRLIASGVMNYVFERDHALLVAVRLPEGTEPGVVFPVDARIDYLVCTLELCVPETANVTVELRTGSQSTRNPAFDGYREALPRPMAEPARFEVAGGRFRLAIPLAAGTALDDPYFFPGTADALRHGEPERISRSGDLLIVEGVAGPRAGALAAIEGVIQLRAGAGLALTARPGPVPAAGTPVATRSGGAADGAAGEGPGFLMALLGALLGGLVLNIMPCVFPILSLKALNLARAGETQAGARREALAYSAGVIATCLALGALLLILRAGGAMVGWAFQLQDPRVILLLLLLVTAIALNLAGLFRLPMLTGGGKLAARGGLAGAFFTGALAAFIATPCTGPFMGAALGAALVLPWVQALALFAGLGLGLALPFLALGFIPALRRRLPRPGKWMARLQRILSVPMFLTALGLAWILGRQTGVDGMTLGLAGALMLALGLWWVGRGGGLLAWALILFAAIGPMLAVRATPPEQRALESPLPAEPFSEARLAQYRAAGTPVFLYFTADWCLTCKVNERGALASAAVAEHFRARGVKVLVGDWTLGDAAIGRFLERHGRSGVPFYLYYPPNRPPEVLPQILTVGELTAL
ncbi:MAG TPA: protein-disulfide reductase DsbD domain-containing protein [Allosphingosinicella sp.]|nr:protein-disulfide reductase DsbD domain-containing protein [Allosphingosinicella sp.]